VVSRAATDDIYGVALDSSGQPLSDNVQGETQQKLDVVCNEIMIRAFCGSSDNVAAIASEEEDDARLCSVVMDSNQAVMGEYVAVFDPLDGSKVSGCFKGRGAQNLTHAKLLHTHPSPPTPPPPCRT
jgi:fructose-1,6-bisphosphatase I